jgi:hypothetical protein
MPSLSAAFRRFETRLGEVTHLVSLSQRKVSGRSIRLGSNEHSAALCRAATVLLSSHIQGYIEDLSDVIVGSLISGSISASRIPDSFRYHSSRKAIDSIVAVAGDSRVQKIRDYFNEYGFLIDIEANVTERFEALPFKDGFGNPTVDEIKRFLRRFGFANFEGEMRRRLRADWLVVENAINQTIDRRNKIAHGDPLATLTPRDLRQYLSLVRKFCATADSVTTKHFRSIGCAI